MVQSSNPLGPSSRLHVAIIMDGNGRWATRRGLPRVAGHSAGAAAVRRVVEAAPGLGVGTLTLFAFSSDNWQRPSHEITLLMQLFHDYLFSEKDRCIAQGIRLRVIGRRDRLPLAVRRAVEVAEAETVAGQTMQLRIAVDYSSQETILRAAKQLAQSRAATREDFARALAEVSHDGELAPEVDLLIRTSGEQRLSDFLLWESAYAELCFTHRLWPDFDSSDLEWAVREFQTRDRRYGQISQSASSSSSTAVSRHYPDAERPDVRRPACPMPWSSEEWCNYFRLNARSLLEIPWERGAELSTDERRAIAQSMQGFQLGESSEGRHLIRCAQAHALRTRDHAYVDVVRLFIAEEQRHARDLGRFLSIAGVSLADRTWPDAVFRWLRHRAGLEISIAVLITAEIIAKVYYAALGEATGSVVLRRLCEQILRDEREHVRFQAERLAILRRHRGAGLIECVHGLQRFLFWGTCLVVWWEHGQAMRAGGYGLRRFWAAAWREMHATLLQMDPRRYAFSRRQAVRDDRLIPPRANKGLELTGT